jgi:glycosyltransferase involved in cell wall biosynthesis
MKVMVVGRLFSGLAETLADGDWRPAGVPAFYRLLEGLADDPDITLLTVLTGGDRRRRYENPRIGSVVVLPNRGGFGGRIDMALTMTAHLFACLRLYTRHRPDVVYFTNANFHIAAAFARLGLGRVVLRFLGIFDQHRRLARGGARSWRARIEAWLFRSPFAQVVCSQDGSDPQAVLPALLRPGVPCEIRLNGVDSSPPSAARIAEVAAKHGLGGRPVVTFLGRLETYKGSDDFLAGAMAYLDRHPDGADIMIVGNGPRLGPIAEQAAASPHHARLHVVGSVPHGDVGAYFAASDIYVSLNRYGNLSNANLEALAMGLCMVFLASDEAVPVDTMTDTLIPREAALRVSRDDTPGSLAQALADLIGSPEDIARRKTESRTLAAQLLKSWPTRIEADMAILTGRQTATSDLQLSKVANG